MKLTKSKLRELIREDLLNEAVRLTAKDENNFSKFIKDLEKISKKYGVAISSTGGVDIGKIKSIRYVDDPSSGDLDCRVAWED